jgi:hypothetical protein
LRREKMIELQVADYCNECPMFTPKVKREYKGYTMKTTIQCEDRMKCAYIKKNIAPKMLGGQS